MRETTTVNKKQHTNFFTISEGPCSAMAHIQIMVITTMISVKNPPFPIATKFLEK